ncbi:MAG: serine hydrolase [Candidatus Bathyarchaeota archaeon]|nr:serine hydrolase [Candidatus Bathyarchaeota archaeon]MDH5788230.1 serine hydrolase [Candidatus Bathyarchaeota archaeon]
MQDFGKLEDFIFEKMSKTHLPGLSIAIVKDGETIYSRGFSFRDLEYGLRATPETLYGIGSVTKSFTALSIMQLVEEGKLSLEDPVSKHAPLDLKSGEEPVRIWHLLSHASGLPALAYAEAYIRYVTGADGKWMPVASSEDLFNFMKDANKWALTKPGERWFYLNEGYVTLGYIIEKLSGMRYVEYVKKRILEPLKMTRSFFKKEDVDADRDVAVPYIITRDGECKKSVVPYGIGADGGLLSNVLDLARYVNMYINRGNYDGGSLLSEEHIEEMEKPRIKLPIQIFNGEAYGYGLMTIPNFLGNKLVGHGGSVLVYTAYIGYIPDKKIGIALLANGSGYMLSQMSLYGLALMLGENPETLPFIKMERTFELLSGLYETYKGTMKAQVVEKGGILELQIKDKYTDMMIPLIPENIDNKTKTFYTVQAGGKLPIEFMTDEDKVELIYERYRLKKVGKL